MTEHLWLDISKIAHALAARHDTASYYRPQYLASLLNALRGVEFTDLREIIAGDLFGAIEAQCVNAIPVSDRDTLWNVFGVERCAPSVEVLQRSRAARGLEALLTNSSLPSSLVAHARELQHASTPFTIRVLGLNTHEIAKRLYRNPLDPYRSLLALGEWRLTKESSDVETLQNWVSNVIHHQVWYRVVIGQIGQSAVEDISQEVTLRTLEQLAIYQPGCRTSLSNWTFNVVNQSISMAGRSLRREHNPIAFLSPNLDRFGPPGSNLDAIAAAEAAELVEYAMTRLRESGSRQNIAERIQIFVHAIPVLLGGEAPRTQAELEHQLKLLIPTIDSEHVHRILIHSGLPSCLAQGAR